MTDQPRFPFRLVAGLFIAIATDTTLQLVWKTGVASLPDDLSAANTAAAVLANPMFLIVIGLMVVQLVNWLKVLDHADLSFAKPFTSLSYISVSLLSVLLLNERIAPIHLVGILIVMAGVWFVGATPRKTVRTGSASA